MFWTVTGLALGREQCKTKNPGSRSFRESFGGDDQIWTGGWGFCRPLPYHLATSPYKGVMNTTPMERPTRLELATSTLARWRSTRWATAAYKVPPIGIEPMTRGFSVPCSTDWATEANWRPGSGSNRRPLAWQASVLTNWTTGPLRNVLYSMLALMSRLIFDIFTFFI